VPASDPKWTFRGPVHTLWRAGSIAGWTD